MASSSTTSVLEAKVAQLNWEIEQQKLISEQMQNTRNETEQIFNIAIPLCLININFTILRVNDTFCELSGYHKDAIIGKPCYSIWSSSLCNTENCPLQKVIKSGKLFSTEGIKIINGIEKVCLITANPFRDSGNNLTAIVENFIDITPRKQIETELIISKKELIEKNQMLEEKNSALKELMTQFRQEKIHYEEQITDNVQNLILPTLNKLREQCSSGSRALVDILESNLNELTSPFGKSISRKMLKLTQKEIAICNMIKTGLDSKEIASLLNLSYKTVETHRKNIRKKFGIVRSQQNLNTFLQSV